MGGNSRPASHVHKNWSLGRNTKEPPWETGCDHDKQAGMYAAPPSPHAALDTKCSPGVKCARKVDRSSMLHHEALEA